MPPLRASASDVSIRTARRSDTDDVAGLMVQLGYEVDRATFAARLSRILARSDQQVMIAETSGRAVGWVHVALWEYLETEPFVVIAGLVVDANHRRHGIGRLLMTTAEQWARDRGCTIVRLWSSSSRTAAHRFYESLGYTNIKTQFSFAKVVDPVRGGDLQTFVPRVQEQLS